MTELEGKYKVGQRVAFAVSLTCTRPLEGRVRAILPHLVAPIYRVAWDHKPQHVHWNWHREDRLAPAVTAGPVYRKCSDIPDILFLEAIEACRHASPCSNGEPAIWATRWDVAAYLAGDLDRVGGRPDNYPNVPEKVILAKIRRLDRRGVISGCGDGCRGDLEVADKGRQMLAEQADAQRDARIAAAARGAKPSPPFGEVVRQWAEEQRARMTPAQRAASDAVTDLTLHGEARIRVVNGEFAPWPEGDDLYSRTARDLVRIGFGTPSALPLGERLRQDALDAFGVPPRLRQEWAEIDRESLRRVLPEPKPCREVAGTWIHQQPHSCPRWARG